MTKNRALAAALIGVCGLVIAGTAHAQNNAALRQVALQAACVDGGGRFELSWAYNDRGVRWGRVLFCSTSAGYIACQDNICRGDRWALPDGVAAARDGSHGGDGAMRFRAEPEAFTAALAALSGE